MDYRQKKSILSHLAKKAEIGSKELLAIQDECAKICASLRTETQYDHISDLLELLGAIAYRVYDETVIAVRDVLVRLKNIELTYQEIQGYSVESIHEYHNNAKLMIKAIEILEGIRYHKPLEILDIFFEYSCYEDDSVAKQAENGVNKIAVYHLDIFYGDGKGWQGLGWQPQEMVLEKIASLSSNQREKYFNTIIAACKELLSPIITGTSSTYNTVTWKTTVVPANEGIKNIRKNALVELERLYEFAANIDQKKSILNVMGTAMDTPHMGDYGDDVLSMVIENTISVAEFIKRIASDEELQIKQKIEHDAYWMLQHKGELNAQIHEKALQIRDVLYANNEYQIFRILIGFESIFHDWKKGGKERDDYDEEKKYRDSEARRLAESVTTDTYAEWKDRIIRYANIESNDLATFPYFGKFLEYFGQNSPELAVRLLNESAEIITNFISAILRGVAKSDLNSVYALIDNWCDEGKYLFSLARFFEYASTIDDGLIGKILKKAEEADDLATLSQIIAAVSGQYIAENKHHIRCLFIPALNVLTLHKDTRWLFDFWYRKQRSNIIIDMEVAEQKVILDNLFWLNQIDYHAEEVLCVIANLHPELVVKFFCERLSKEKEEEITGKYEAVPYNFYKLSEPLSKYLELVVDAVRDTYDGNYGLFVYRGAMLLKNIFPNYPLEFQQKLIDLIQSREKDDLLFVMAILRNYDGRSVVQGVCKEIICILPDGSDLENEINIILQSTGVVNGEYGFVEAYKQKVEEIQPWLNDDNAKVQMFARRYIENLELQIERERKRADEDIALRKYKYGSDGELE
ncbi:MAG: hypothetical protein RPU60_00155 [Candidatus Sedimenticola sp. (ex Thyasira tokunagai)]